MRDDRSEILETIYCYATGVDTQDWQLYRSIFTDEIELDFSSWDGRPARRMPADGWLAAVKGLFPGLDASQHSMTNPRVTFDGDRAQCVMYVQAAHFLRNDEGDSEFTAGGYYTDQLVRTPSGWKLCGVKLTVTWSRGNKHVMTLARRRVAEATGS
jgi:3-phenylpropionate/cinnamic acid dioxygenase small subunit